MTHNGPLTTEQERWAAVLHAGSRAALSHHTSATLDGLQRYADELVHVTVPHSSSVQSRSFVRVHRARCPPDECDDIHPVHEPPRMRLPRAVVEMARAARRQDDARGPLAAAVQQGLVRAGDLRDVLRRVGPVPREASLVVALDDIENGAHSVLELDFVQLVRECGAPMPHLQTRLLAGGVRRLDATWPAYGVWAEVDGAAHREDSQWQADLDRHNEVSVAGQWRANLRFSAQALRRRRTRCARQLVAALRQGGWTG
ncbi:MAG TPA: hypothetical protein VEZ46_11985 [Mycobacteriales bacterium]|nr:hypothetical protein [Mycobacteriales bacterium]